MIKKRFLNRSLRKELDEFQVDGNPSSGGQTDCFSNVNKLPEEPSIQSPLSALSRLGNDLNASHETALNATATKDMRSDVTIQNKIFSVFYTNYESLQINLHLLYIIILYQISYNNPPSGK